MFEKVARRIDGWVPPGLPDDAQAGARFLFHAWVIAIPVALASVVVYALAHSWAQASLAVELALTGVIAIAWLRRSWAIAAVTHFSLASATFSFGASTLSQTPADITNVAFLAVMPLVATFILGQRRARIWLVIPMVLAMVLLWAADRGYTLPFMDETPLVSHALNIMLLLIVVWLFARSFAAVRAAALERVREADRAKSVFLATVSHEIRTPMNAVIGMTELVLSDTLTPAQRERMQVVQRSGGLLVALINDVLDVMKIEAHKLELESLPFDLQVVLSDLHALHRVPAEARGLSFELQLDPALPSFVSGDPLRLTQVLGNLVSNAVKFTERGSVVVRVRAGCGARIRFEVEDTGPGIEPSALRTLFHRFQQVGAGTTRRHGGTGLGLALARELVELMGGTLEVVSAVGVGSRFAFAVPLPLAAAPEAAVARPEPIGPGARVLVVDDNPVNVAVAVGLLERMGCVVDAAGSGREALERAAVGGYALILMDLYMADMDGLETTRRLRAEGSASRATPIVGLTASVVASELAACREAGMDDVLEKPVTPARLAAALARYARGVGRSASKPPQTRPGRVSVDGPAPPAVASAR
ncbi:MAG: ATP-binding protein [Myxococcota bacterium]